MDLILANRALVDDDAAPGRPVATGGLVEAVRPVLTPWDGAAGSTWIGAGVGPRGGAAEGGFAVVETPSGPIRHRRLAVGVSDWRGHYAEVANGFFWPLLHLVRRDLPACSPAYPVPAPPREAAWAAFERVNGAFAEAALAAGGDLCWVHDYQLALVPALLRAGGFRGRTGFFLHTPFPDLAVAEPYLPAPARARFTQWLAGILGAGLAGLQTEADAERLREAAERLCGARSEGPDLRLPGRDGRLVRIAAFPAGIDAEAVAREAAAGAPPEGVRREGSAPLVVGLERADYTKGIPERLAAVIRALEGGARFAYAGFSAPTRAGVAAYEALGAETERLAERAAALAAERGLPFTQSREALAWPQVLGLLREADVVFTASLADGMNLVPLQAAIAQSSRPPAERGVILAGREAGVASAYAGFEREGLVPFDPLDIEGAAEALVEALAGRPGRVGERLVAAVRERDAQAWGRTFLAALEAA